MKILAVDDDPMLLELLVASLAGAGYDDVMTAGSAVEAAGMLEDAADPFECILLDIQMPEIDGITLCGFIRELPDYRNTPIVMITAMTERDFVERAFRAGANDYVSKPFDALELKTRLRVAADAVRQQRVVTDKIFALKNYQQDMEARTHFDADAPVCIEDVPGVVDHLVLQNYVLQLSRGKSLMTSAIAFRIEEFDEIYGRAAPNELYLALTDVAEAIAEQYKGQQFLMSYFGNGTYVVISTRNESATAQDLGDATQLTVDSMDLRYEDGSECPVSIVAGQPQSRGLFFSGKPMQLVHDAIDSARKGKSSKRMMADLPNASTGRPSIRLFG